MSQHDATTAEQTTEDTDSKGGLVDADLPMSFEESVTSLLEWGQGFWDLLTTPGWRQYQILILVLLVGVAYLLRLLTARRVDNWMRARQGWPKWRLRILVQLRQRLALLYFAALTWLLYAVMQQVTWPSRSYIIGIFATLALAWLVIALATRMVHNQTLRQVLRWSLWFIATVAALGLTDEIAGFLDGIALSFGDVRISLLGILKAIVLIIVMLIAARLLSQAAAIRLRRNQDISPSTQVLAAKSVQLLLYTIVIIIGFQSLGFDLTGLAFLSGAIGVGIGFGLQKVVSNLVSGIIILLDRSIKPGDVISLGDTFGWIDALSARYVSVVTRDGREYLIPNEDLITGQVVNWSYSDDFVRLDITFGTSYDDDPHEVRRIALEAVNKMPRVLTDSHNAVCHITGFGDSSVDYILRFWIADPSSGLTNIRGQVYLALWDAFKENGVSIPFPQREVRVMNEAAPVEMRPPEHVSGGKTQE